jgi:hypothetical protein
MTTTAKFLPTERTLDNWHNGQITLPDAHEKLVRLGHGSVNASDMLQTHDPDRYAAQHRSYLAADQISEAQRHMEEGP